MRKIRNNFGSITEYLMWGIFVTIGSVFFIIGILICIGNLNYENTTQTVGVISEIKTRTDSDGDIYRRVYVKYEADGTEYETELDGYSSSYYEGKEIEIYYDNDNPYDVGVKSFDYLLLIFPGMGLIFLLIGGIGLGVKINGRISGNKLKQFGQKVYANYSTTILNRSYTVNGRHPYNIICEWNSPEDGKKYILKSKNIWFNPENIIAEKNITMFAVYMNPENRKKYLIDTDILTENVVDLT